MQTIHETIGVNDIQPLRFCGKVVGYMMTGDIYQLPFEIKSFEGDHDFNKCPICLDNLKSIEKQLQSKMKDSEDEKGFPFCCELHANLIKVKMFKRDDFLNIPEQATRKIIYTNQHIINNYDAEDWFKKIADYIRWAVESFGQMPKDCGEPLFLKFYLDKVIGLLNNTKAVPREKKDKVIRFLHSFQEIKQSKNTDWNILLATYEKWFKIFPFEISYFQHLKKKCETSLPVFKGKPDINLYSGVVTMSLHSKDSLIEAMIDQTNSLLTSINGAVLYEKGLIKDGDKIKLELVINSRKLKLKEGYGNNSKDEEQRYRRMLKNWFADEKKFFDEIKPLLRNPEAQENIAILQPINANISTIKNNFDNVSIQVLFDHFKKELVDKKHLTENELIDYLKAAFENKRVPIQPFTFKNVQTKQRVIRVFYTYYKIVACKPFRKQKEYAALLGDYFEGFETKTVIANFNK